MKIRLFIITCVVFFAFASSAQQSEVKSVTVQQAIDLAKKNNYTLQNSRLDQKLSEKKVNEVLSLGLPQINASGSFNDYIDIPTQLAPLSFFNPKAAADAYMAIKFGVPYTASGTL